jgi:ABC-type Fe3+/spermidine/putrescine transport system ATPase subunit
VVFDGVTKQYGSSTALAGVSLEIRKGEFFSLLGPSGCGKTTTLRILAGFVSATSGSVTIGGRDVTGTPPERRGIGLVPQDYAIFPHLTVFENVAFGLKVRKVGRAEIKERVDASLAQVGLSEHAGKHRRHLSGGQQQRVALARALVTEPQVLLLDEPLSALDLKLREEMRYWIRDLQHRLGITTVYVTHDQTEALTMSDRIAVMSRGRVEQIGSPEDLYERPESRFVAQFLGMSSALPVAAVQGVPAPRGATRVLVRPEQVVLSPAGHRTGDDEGWLDATVSSVSYEGAVLRYELRAASGVAGSDVPVLVGERPNRAGDDRLAVGDRVVAHWAADAAMFFDE